VKTALLILLIITSGCLAQDTVIPFRYIGGGKWTTGTEFVRQYDRDLAKLNYYDSVFAETEKQNKIYSMIIDSMKEQISMYKKIIDSKNLMISNKQNYIDMLEKPVKIDGNMNNGSTPLFSYNGLYVNIGAAYKFDTLMVTGDRILKGIKYFGSLETGFELLGKIRFDLEVIVPLEIKLKGGYKL
jgi:hypothetical protein